MISDNINSGTDLFSTTSTITETSVVLAGGQHVLNGVVSAGWALGATTQILVTLLLSWKIYKVSNGFASGSSRHMGIIWVLVESGLVIYP